MHHPLTHPATRTPFDPFASAAAGPPLTGQDAVRMAIALLSNSAEQHRCAGREQLGERLLDFAAGLRRDEAAAQH